MGGGGQMHYNQYCISAYNINILVTEPLISKIENFFLCSEYQLIFGKDWPIENVLFNEISANADKLIESINPKQTSINHMDSGLFSPGYHYEMLSVGTSTPLGTVSQQPKQTSTNDMDSGLFSPGEHYEMLSVGTSTPLGTVSQQPKQTSINDMGRRSGFPRKTLDMNCEADAQ